MDFDQAIAAHAAWKGKLSQYLANPDKSLQPSEIAADNRCELGKWIAGEGKKYEKIREYDTVKMSHTQFHKVAAEIVQRANAGKAVSADVVLGAKSEFASASSAVVRAVMALKSRVRATVSV
jgi:chemoreceptor zinc-binding protein